MPSLASALVYPALVPFEGSNLSVGRGTDLAFQRLGASWLDAKKVVDLLGDRPMSGVHFVAERFTPVRPGDNKYAGKEIPGVRVVVDDRERVQVARVGAALLWAIAKVHKDSLKLNDRTVDLRLGAAWARVALVRGDDPDEVIDKVQPDVIAWQRKVKPYLLY